MDMVCFMIGDFYCVILFLKCKYHCKNLHASYNLERNGIICLQKLWHCTFTTSFLCFI